MTKICPRPGCAAAGAPQPAENFNKHAGRRDGLSQYCRACDSTRGRSLRERYKVPGAATEPNVPPAPPIEHIQETRYKNEIARLRSQLQEAERLALSSDRLREVIGSLGSPNINPSPEWLRGASRQRGTHGTGVLFLSDVHFDEVVQPTQIGGSNTYNRQIAIESLRNTFRTAVVLLKGYMAIPKYDGFVCPLGGDLLSGNIHEELAETNEAPIQQSMLALEETMIEGLGSLADEFGKVHVPCVVGNHGRLHRKPRAKNRAFENFEWAVYQRLAAYFKRDPRLTFDISDGSDAAWNIYTWRYLLTHGDQFRGGDGIGGIMVPIMRGAARKQVRQQALGDAFDVLMIGHWHQYIHTNHLIVNGSVKGYDEFSYQMNFPFEPPQQALFVVHPEVGVSFRMPVLCRHQGENRGASTLVRPDLRAS